MAVERKLVGPTAEDSGTGELAAVELGGDGGIGAGASAVWHNREGLSRYAVRWHWVDDPEGSGFTAVLRVKNEARSLPWVLPGVLRSVSRVVVVDNGSTDGTAEVAERVARQAGLEEKLRIVAYPFAASRCGPEHLATYPDSVRSLTHFYNWSFSQSHTRYSLKWDGDMVLTPQGEKVLRDLAWQLQGIGGTVRTSLSPVYVESERVAYVDRAQKHSELCGWPNTPDHTFVKGFDWEYVKPWAGYLLQLPDWVCFELKWLDRDQFSHWSRTDFKNFKNLTRKKREQLVSRVLLAGADLPRGVHRIESPEGTHVVEHLRQMYMDFCRRGRPDAQAERSEETRMSRDLLLVAGSGRSGTSLFASIVGNLGFHVPEPQVEADSSNPRGFGEPQWVVDKHTQLLRQAGVQTSDARPSSWAHTARLGLNGQTSAGMRNWLEDQFEGHERLVVKDPRLLWFLPMWNRVGEELGANVSVVTMLRHPAEVVRSKMNWYAKMPLVDANRVAGWANTMLFTERATRDSKRTFVRFEDLLEDWTQQVAHVSARFDMPSLVNARAREQAQAGSLVDPTLRRSQAGWDDLDGVPKSLIQLCEGIWENLLALSSTENADTGATLGRLDELREEYVTLYHNAEQIAQSSIIAASRKATQEAQERAREAQKKAQEAQKKAREAQTRAQEEAALTPAAAEQIPVASFLVAQVRKRVPAGARNIVPRRVKLALVRLFG